MAAKYISNMFPFFHSILSIWWETVEQMCQQHPTEKRKSHFMALFFFCRCIFKINFFIFPYCLWLWAYLCISFFIVLFVCFIYFWNRCCTADMLCFWEQQYLEKAVPSALLPSFFVVVYSMLYIMLCIQWRDLAINC